MAASHRAIARHRPRACGAPQTHGPARRRLRDRLGPGRARSPAQERTPAAIATLPPDARRILALTYKEGLTQRQIAVVTGRPIGTVKTVLRSTLGAVRRIVSAPAEPGGRDPFTSSTAGCIRSAVHDGSGGGGRRSITGCRRPGPRLPSLAGLHVLGVDDDEQTRELVEGIFQRTGAHGTLCGDAADGLAALAAVWPDVLVADIHMPGIDGYGLMAHVRVLKERYDRRLPALAFTACSSEADRSRARLAGFDLHLSKPLHPAALGQAVRDLTAGAC